jgi:hypothetical protein
VSSSRGTTGDSGWAPASERTVWSPWNGDGSWPNPAAIPSRSSAKRFWSTWLIANSTMNSTISSVTMSA